MRTSREATLIQHPDGDEGDDDERGDVLQTLGSRAFVAIVAGVNTFSLVKGCCKKHPSSRREPGSLREITNG